MSKTFIYLVPPKRRGFYKTRNEDFVIAELRDQGHTVHRVGNFHTLKTMRLLKSGPVDALIFNSLKVGHRNRRLLSYLKDRSLPVYWWYFDTAELSRKRLSRVIETAQLVDVFFNKDKRLFRSYEGRSIHPVWLDQGVPRVCQFVESETQNYDLGFFGSYHIAHQERSDLLKVLDRKH